MSKSVMTKISTGNQNKQAKIASYELSLLIAKKRVSHTVRKEIILPAAKIISDNLFGEKYSKLINDIPLSNTNVKRRIDEMADSVKDVLITTLKQSDFFALQLDESTDVAGLANLLAFVRFESNGSIEEELLFCKSLPSTTSGEEVFKCLDNFIKDNAIDWSKCVGLTTDGAAAMSGKFRGLIALSDVFSYLNALNMSLQGKDIHKFYVQDKIEATIKKIARWGTKVDENNFDSFSTMQDFIESHDVTVDKETATTVKEDLSSLVSNLRNYFPTISDNLLWMKNPFDEDNLKNVTLTSAKEDALIELSCDSALKSVFKDTSLVSFWIKVKNEYPELSKMALMELMGFTTTYLCERSFSSLVFLKNKYRNRLCAVNDLRLRLTTFNPDIETIVSNAKECHKSH